MISQGIKSACPYCGVGCGVVTKLSEIIGDVSHPTNRGVLSVKAYVMSRGIVGDQDGVLCVVSALLKQHYDLATGKCLEMPEHILGTWKTRWNNNELWLYTG